MTSRIRNHGYAVPLLLVAILFASACTSSTDTSPTTDSTLSTTTTAVPDGMFVGVDGVATDITDISRIVSLTGDITEVIFELGLGGHVVAVDITPPYPPEPNAIQRSAHRDGRRRAVDRGYGDGARCRRAFARRARGGRGGGGEQGVRGGAHAGLRVFLTGSTGPRSASSRSDGVVRSGEAPRGTALGAAWWDDVACPGDPGCDAGSAYLLEAAAPGKCPWDLGNRGDVGVKDLLFLLGAWGPCPPKGDCLADFDTTGDVGVKDLLVLLGNWGPCP